jgi:hypothetical protein
MPFYMWIRPTQEPFNPGMTPPGHAELIFNIQVRKEPSATFVEELIKILVTAGVGVLNTNIFAGNSSMIPVGDGPYLTIVPTGGLAPVYVQNLTTPRHVRPSASINVQAKNFEAARTMAQAAYDAFVAVVNVDVVP